MSMYCYGYGYGLTVTYKSRASGTCHHASFLTWYGAEWTWIPTSRACILQVTNKFSPRASLKAGPSSLRPAGESATSGASGDAAQLRRLTLRIVHLGVKDRVVHHLDHSGCVRAQQWPLPALVTPQVCMEEVEMPTWRAKPAIVVAASKNKRRPSSPLTSPACWSPPARDGDLAVGVGTMSALPKSPTQVARGFEFAVQASCCLVHAL